MSRFDDAEEPAEDLTSWLAAGYGRREALSLRRWNFTVEQAARWRRVGVDDALVAAQWQAAGVRPDTVGAWAAANIGAAAAIRWHEFGFTAAQAGEYAKQGRGPDEAYQRRQQQSTGQRAGGSGAWIRAFLDAGVPHQVVGSYRQLDWLDEEAVAWAKHGIDAGDARAWQLIGLTAVEGGDLHKQGMRPLEVIRDWWQAGIPFAEVADWLGAGLTPAEAVTQRANGVTVEQAAALRALRNSGS